MSVIMTLRAKGDGSAIERYAAENEEQMRGILERAKRHGLIAHRFYGSDGGEVLVVDEWPDPGSFQAFFQEAQSEIQPIMQAAGATGEPEVTFWNKLDTRDEHGWDA